VQGAATQFNPTLPQSVVDRALERDHAAGSAEYLAIFRSDIENFISREALAKCVDAGVLERPPISNVSYRAFVDPSGGSADSMTLCVGHREKDVVIIDCVREVRPPFSPEDCVEEFCVTLRGYNRINKVVGDRYAGEWPRERFRERKVAYEVSAKSKADLYLNFLPAINSARVRLLDHPRLINQLAGLERRTTRGTGKDVIDHGPGAHDDIANCVAGLFGIVAPYSAYVLAPFLGVTADGSAIMSRPYVAGDADGDADAEAAAAAEFQRARFQAHLHSGSMQYGGFRALRRI